MIRIACIGLGWVAINRHIPSIMRTPGLRLVGVVDRHASMAQRVAEKLSLKNFTQDDHFASSDWMGDVDAVSIAAPPCAHHDLVIEALTMGKHVITEKPFALSNAEGLDMVRASEKNVRNLSVIHNLQFSRAMKKLVAAIESNQLGLIKGVEIRRRANPKKQTPRWVERLPLGLFYDESPHTFYLLRRVVGKSLRLVDARCAPSTLSRNTPASVSMVYKSASAVPVTIDCNFESSTSDWTLIVDGEHGVGIVDLFTDLFVFVPNDGQHTIQDLLKTTLYTSVQKSLQLACNITAQIRGRMDYGNDEVFSRFANALHQGKRAESIGCEDALDVLKLQHEALAALSTNVLS